VPPHGSVAGSIVVVVVEVVVVLVEVVVARCGWRAAFAAEELDPLQAAPRSVTATTTPNHPRGTVTSSKP
jgi:hypothetical protein